MNIHCGNVVANNKQYHYVCLVDGYNNSVIICHADRWFSGNIYSVVPVSHCCLGICIKHVLNVSSL